MIPVTWGEIQLKVIFNHRLRLGRVVWPRRAGRGTYRGPWQSEEARGLWCDTTGRYLSNFDVVQPATPPRPTMSATPLRGAGKPQELSTPAFLSPLQKACGSNEGVLMGRATLVNIGPGVWRASEVCRGVGGSSSQPLSLLFPQHRRRVRHT